jgi:hypothetical protein
MATFLPALGGSSTSSHLRTVSSGNRIDSPGCRFCSAPIIFIGSRILLLSAS